MLIFRDVLCKKESLSYYFFSRFIVLIMMWSSELNVFSQTASKFEDIQFTHRWFSAFTQSDISYEDINKNNIFGYAFQTFESQLREDFRFKYQTLTLTLRPNISLVHNKTAETVSLDVKHKNKISTKWTEASFQWNAMESTFFVYGLQNFQWGPAESFNASNGIFKETVQQRTLTYQSRGKHLLRLNYSWTPETNTIFLTEISDHSGDEPFLTDVPFYRKYLQKTETSWNSGFDYLGIVLGGEEAHLPYWGSYFNFSYDNGLSVYGDGRIQSGATAWYPQKDNLTSNILLEQNQLHSKKNKTSGVLGLRYAFVNGTDVRYEYIHFEPGYNQQQQKLLRNAILSTSMSQMITTAGWLHRLKGLGTEFPGQRFSYLSIRIPNIMDIIQWNLSGRIFFSHLDQSSQYYLSTDWTVGNVGTWSFSSLFSPSPIDRELGSPLSSTLFLGYEHVW